MGRRWEKSEGEERIVGLGRRGKFERCSGLENK
jgi:hypothetical protein